MISSKEQWESISVWSSAGKLLHIVLERLASVNRRIAGEDYWEDLLTAASVSGIYILLRYCTAFPEPYG